MIDKDRINEVVAEQAGKALMSAQAQTNLRILRAYLLELAKDLESVIKEPK